MSILKTEFGMHIIDDTYNANPGSMEAAIRTLDSLKGDGRGVVVIGDMLELGEYAESMHRMIGALSARIRMSRLYATGTHADAVAAGAGDEGMDIESVFTGTMDEIFSDLTERLQPDDWVLVKGSNAMGMEEIVRRLKDWANVRAGEDAEA
jgi:UDP-N-acetylmuramyl pentapeptide synthase